MKERSDEKLEALLVRDGSLSQAEIDVARDVARRRGDSLALALRRMDLMEAGKLESLYEQAFGLPFVDLQQMQVQGNVAHSLGEAFCRRNSLLPLLTHGDGAEQLFALSDPGNVIVVDALKQRMAGSPLALCVCDVTALEVALTQTFAVSSSDPAAEVIEGAVEALQQILHYAIERRVSDIHLEPMPDCARLRLRCDGVLEKFRHLTTDDWQPLLVRIKVLAKLDIADSRRPQDGRFAFRHQAREVDVRVSVLPTDCGEAVVMRILDRQRAALDLQSLGVSAADREKLHRLMQRPEGMVLVSGPTGSGKSTTLYALVELIRAEALNIITLEDPVEIPATWVRQSSINESVCMSYAEAVRAALRQDPDVMLIGEMRDAETAEMALRAAMTGHRVLSTVHSNGALASVSRLWDLGLNPRLLAGNLSAVVAQRLLRKLCLACRREDGGSTPQFKAVGCQLCGHKGYLGRQAVMEIWEVGPDFDDLLHQRAPRSAFTELARASGMVGLQQAAMALARQGVTSEEEVLRVTGPLSAELVHE